MDGSVTNRDTLSSLIIPFQMEQLIVPFLQLSELKIASQFVDSLSIIFRNFTGVATLPSFSSSFTAL